MALPGPPSDSRWPQTTGHKALSLCTRNGEEPQFGELQGDRADASAGTVDQELLPRLELALVVETLPGQSRGVGNRGGLDERQGRGLGKQGVCFRTDVLCIGAEATGVDIAVHGVAGLESLDILPRRLDHSRDVAAGDLYPRLEPAEDRAQGGRRTHDEPDVPVVHGRCMDAYQDLVVGRNGLGNLCQLDGVRRSVFRLDDGFHRILLAVHRPSRGRAGRRRSR